MGEVGVKIENIYLLDSNPRHTMTKETKDRLRNIEEIDLDENSNYSSVKKLFKYEGDFSDLYDLIFSLNKMKYQERSNPLILMKVGKKYVVSDGNRRFMAILMLNKKLDINKLVEDVGVTTKKAKNNIEKIKEVLENSEFTFTNFTNSSIYEKNEIEEMFIEINLKHTGYGNGKRNWPRGKMLKEVYQIYSSASTHEEGVESIISDHGVSRKKAESDIGPAVFVNEIFEIYKSNFESEIELELIAPSSLELIKSTRFGKNILEHSRNTQFKKNISELFNFTVEKNQDGKFFTNLTNLQMINEVTLSNILFDGYNENYQNESDELALDSEYETNIEKENLENSGFVRNLDYTTRKWTDHGEEKLLDVLNWPNERTIEQKAETINVNPSKIFVLSAKDASEIISSNDIREDIKIKIKEALKEYSGNKFGAINFPTEKKKNFIYNVLVEIYKQEYARISVEYKNMLFPFSNKNIVSQLAVLRSMHELTEKLIFYTILGMLATYSEMKISDFSKLVKIDWVKKPSESNPDPNVNNPETWVESIRGLVFETDFHDLEPVFLKIKENFGLGMLNGLNGIAKVAQEKCDFPDEETKNKFGKFFTAVNQIQAKDLGQKLSLPMHYIEKFINEKNYETKLKFVEDVSDVEKRYINILKSIVENFDILFDDEIFEEYLKS